MSLEDEVAKNRADVQRQASFFREPARTQTGVEALETLPVDVSVSGSVETRSLQDTLVFGGPTDQQAFGSGRFGDQGGSFGPGTSLTGTVVADGRRAFVEAVAGNTVGLERAQLGSDTATPSAADESLGTPASATDAHGTLALSDSPQLQARLGPRATPDSIGEAAALDGSDRLLARVTPDAVVTTAADEESRLTVTLTLAPDTTSSSAVTDVATLSEAIRSEASDVALDEIVLGTDDTTPSTADTTLGNRVLTIPAGQRGSRDTLVVTGLADAPEPASQPHDLVEAGIRDSGTLVTRQTFPAVVKDDRTRRRFDLAIQFRSE